MTVSVARASKVGKVVVIVLVVGSYPSGQRRAASKNFPSNELRRKDRRGHVIDATFTLAP
jgi:hypothetical protein